MRDYDAVKGPYKSTVKGKTSWTINYNMKGVMVRRRRFSTRQEALAVMEAANDVPPPHPMLNDWIYDLWETVKAPLESVEHSEAIKAKTGALKVVQQIFLQMGEVQEGSTVAIPKNVKNMDTDDMLAELEKKMAAERGKNDTAAN